ncbi:Long-chain fatty acid transport protein 1 [Halotydeus destructor]|nr:Long-chain fatty acid transport protein 1 [Halotydeus destructor]
MSRPGYFKVFCKTFARDLRGFTALKKTESMVGKLKKRNATVPAIFKENVLKHPNKVMLVNSDREWTYDDVDKFTNRVAAYFTDCGLKPGDEVALCMKSCPEFIGFWLGLAKAGLVGALVNTNQRLNPLVHSITTINSKAVIFDDTMTSAIDEIRSQLDSKVQFHYYGDQGPTFASQVKNDLKKVPDQFNTIKGNFSDRLFYIYTSGTTGLPKAAIIKHARFFVTGTGVHNLIRATPDDVIYTCLPLYHFAGGVMGATQPVLYGNTMAIREKFSVSNYWEECIKYKATIGQYIGELCRYLYAQPEKASEKQHKVRLMWGNGIRPNLYGDFRRRFGIQDLLEVYGSTEGNTQIVNLDNKDGACGFVTRILPVWLQNLLYPVALIRCDPESGEPIRNEEGMCIRCEPGEVGQFVGVIYTDDPVRAFDGYSNKEATEKKLISNVLRKGDVAFASGDLLYMDDYGYLYFRDRTGDTFKWKGENVSTTEVESVVMKEAGADAIVYAVEIPGNEGKAGMVAIADANRSLDVNDLLTKLKRSLPAYAIPVLLRVVKEIETTSTLKLPKVQLQKDGHDVNAIKDPVYVLDKQQLAYRRLDGKLYDDFCKGNIIF